MSVVCRQARKKATPCTGQAKDSMPWCWKAKPQLPVNPWGAVTPWAFGDTQVESVEIDVTEDLRILLIEVPMQW